MASIWTLQFRSPAVPVSFYFSLHLSNSSSGVRGRIRIRNSISTSHSGSEWRSQVTARIQHLKQHSINSISKFRHDLVASISPIKATANGGIWVCVAVIVLVAAVRLLSRRRNQRPGSVADLVRRGQLRSDRRGISRALKYEDPFNNPLVKVGKSKSRVEMCGKVYRLAPVTLTEEQRAIHQRRRSRAYQWKRPTMFLREGEVLPPDVDPDTIRWIPANHPFATTASDLDEAFAQNNVYQKHGVPFRIQAEHQALALLQNDLPTNANESDNSHARLNDVPEKTSFSNPPTELDSGPNQYESASSSPSSSEADRSL